MADIDRAIGAISKVISNSTQDMFIVSGALAHEVYGSQKVIGAINEALNRRVHFEIIVGPDYDRDSTFILDKLGDAIYIACAWPTPHFVVGDHRHTRYEPRHDEVENTPASKNMVELDVPQAAEHLVKKFHQLKQELSCQPMKQLCGSND